MKPAWAICAAVVALALAVPAPVRAQVLPRPKPRPGPVAVSLPAIPGLRLRRPSPRPYRGAVDAAVAAAVRDVSAGPARTPAVVPVSALLLARPVPRPAGLTRARVVRASVLPTTLPAPRTTRRGAVCGMRTVRGSEMTPIAGKLAGCGVSAPVRVTSVAGVVLSQPAVMDCTTAKALNSWVENGVKPAVGRLGGGLAELRVIAHYSCRTRNNQPGAKISEHGKGHAVDVAGVRLKNGVEINVLDGWSSPVQAKVLKKMHKSACGPFGTVLGPNADKYHRDHIHVDTARYRSGSYCR